MNGTGHRFPKGLLDKDNIGKTLEAITIGNAQGPKLILRRSELCRVEGLGDEETGNLVEGGGDKAETSDKDKYAAGERDPGDVAPSWDCKPGFSRRCSEQPEDEETEGGDEKKDEDGKDGKDSEGARAKDKEVGSANTPELEVAGSANVKQVRNKPDAYKRANHANNHHNEDKGSPTSPCEEESAGGVPRMSGAPAASGISSSIPCTEARRSMASVRRSAGK